MEITLRLKSHFVGILFMVFFTFQLCASDPIFHESFDETFEGRWVVSHKEDYKGVWKHAKSKGHDDYGLLISEPAKKYAIVKELDNPVELKGRTIALQFETRFQNGLECGGAYLKYLRPQEAGWLPKEFNNESPYSIMFGPDRCGSTDKIHFIFKHRNPKTGEYVEHHLKDPPYTPNNKLTHTYTAVFGENNELQILIDGEEKKKVNFLSSDAFEPSLLPPKIIPDPDDKRPDDWDERDRIPDPNAVKPEDWNERLPIEIEDEEAVKPEGWLDDEPEEIDDPEAKKPEDWDDEEDGEWEPPKIDNPKCEAAPGCGEWKRPMKINPDYKGQWYPPIIDNPDYKGIWKPREIPNPNYFEVSTPDFEPIAAVGIEIWTMQDGILFDNVLIADDGKTAELYRQTHWKPKFDAEKERHKSEEKTASSDGLLSSFQKKIFQLLYKIADIPFLASYKPNIVEWIEKAEAKPTITIGVLVSIIVVFLSIIFKTFFRGKKSVPKLSKAAAAAAASDVIPDVKAKEKEEAGGPRKRSTKRDE